MSEIIGIRHFRKTIKWFNVLARDEVPVPISLRSTFGGQESGWADAIWSKKGKPAIQRLLRNIKKWISLATNKTGIIKTRNKKIEKRIDTKVSRLGSQFDNNTALA